MLTVVVAFSDGREEVLEDVSDWDVRADGHLIAWDDAGAVLAERDGVASTTFRRGSADS